jgi:hypothetical protein
MARVHPLAERQLEIRGGHLVDRADGGIANREAARGRRARLTFPAGQRIRAATQPKDTA